MKPSGAIFLKQAQSRGLGVDVKPQTRWPQGCLARPKGVGAPPTLMGSPRLFWPTSGTPWASSGPKMISVKWHVNWTPFSFLFCDTLKQGENRKLALGSRLIG